MVCRNETGDPRKCEGCGQFLWVSEEGYYCGDCGVTMPCTMRILPIPAGPALAPPTPALRPPSRILGV
jgi:hypothetical protein